MCDCWADDSTSSFPLRLPFVVTISSSPQTQQRTIRTDTAQLTITQVVDVPHSVVLQFPSTSSSTTVGGGSTPTIDAPTTYSSANLTSALTSGSILLSEQCIQTLVHPLQRLTNHRREDIAHISIQPWLFFISVFALVHDSVPHLCVSCVPP